jgi:hypothetical protein
MLPDNYALIAAVWLALGYIADRSAEAAFRRSSERYLPRHVFLSYTVGPVLVPVVAVAAFGWAFLKVIFGLGRK